ncbi:ABC transporter ATP-binding protein [Microbacterium sp.]|uniref:ABC transporter ATP-binding protein n=1 Tax=Microbacterium sp. TaxID=51671 RepID=UPI0039E514B8
MTEPARPPAPKRPPAAARAAAVKSNAVGASAGAKQTAAKSAARAAAAKKAAERAAAAKSSARSTSAQRNAAKTTAALSAARAAAKKAAAEKAAEEQASAVDDTAVAEEASSAEEAASAAEEVESSDEQASAIDEVESIDEVSAADETETADETDIVDKTELVDEVPSVDEAEEVDETAAEEEAAEDDIVDEALGAASIGSVSEDEEIPPARAGEPEPAAEDGRAEAIRIRGLVKTFGDHVAVNGIDLTVPAGTFYGIVGPNGAGKTTTLSIIAGLLRADGGRIVVSGIDQAERPLAAKRAMGVLPDRLRTFDRLTGRQLLFYYGLLRGLAADVIEKRVGDLARAFDLGDALGRVVSDYSAGMTKKVMLAGAMIHSPRVLVLDEPFEAVDPVSSAVILDILRAYVAHGGTVVLSSHGMDLVERVCTRVAIIVDGNVLAEGTIDEVRAGQTLESRFVELSGANGEVEGLEWLHTFSD